MPVEHSRRQLLRTAGLTVGAFLATTATNANATPHRTTARRGLRDVYPDTGDGTNLLNRADLLGDMPEPGWFEANIPFVQLPDTQLQQVYYYRWRVFYEALKYTGPDEGWIVSEFLGPVGYSAPGGAIVAAAAHHIREGRWLRDRRYLDDYLRYWLRGSGAGPKEPSESLNPNTTDWAHQYSFWVADAAYHRAAVSGDWTFLEDLLPDLVRQWEKWAPQYDPRSGLYWQTPVWDAMEYTASSYQSDDPYHGGEGYRPTINSYQYADAIAIADIARRRGDATLSEWFRERAERLRLAQERTLWDGQDGFYKHVMRDDNPQYRLLDDREEIGFVPWMFGMAPPSNAVAWRQLTDPQGFFAEFGPTTVERRSRWFMHEAYEGCCRWDGPSWPYATSQTLTALSNLLIDYPDQPYVDSSDYLELLRGYARTQYKDGEPYVAEAHDPDQAVWIYDSFNHSEDYNHSTYVDLVLSGLLGLRPQADDTLRIHPLVPKEWPYFAVENLAYHGHNVTVLWDSDGSTYGAGSGLSVYLDGTRAHHQPDLTPTVIRVKPGRDPRLPALVDIAANLRPESDFPTASASFSAADHQPNEAIDGQKYFLEVPSTRWTNTGSTNARDWLAVDLGLPRVIDDVRVFFHDDGAGVRAPVEFRLQYRTSTGEWIDVPEQRHDPPRPVGNDLNRVTCPGIETRELRVMLTPPPGASVGIAALQCWRPGSTAE